MGFLEGPGTIAFFVVFFLCWYGITGVMVYFGSVMISEGAEYQRNSTEEQCLLVEYVAEECTYDCNCDSDGDHCSTCNGIQYDYVAVVDKCDDEPIYSHELDKVCPGALKNIGSEYTCYVLDCDEAEFSFTKPGARMGWGIALVVFASIFVFAPCCCGFCFWQDKF